MTYNIRITDKAQEDIGRAADYIEFVLKNPDSADELLDAAEAEIGSLSAMPERYQIPDDDVLRAWGIRYVQVKSYLAFYTVDKATATVNVIRFLYGKRDWDSILRHDLLDK